MQRRTLLASLAAGMVAPLVNAPLAFGKPILTRTIRELETQAPYQPIEELASDEDFWLQVQQAYQVDRTVVNLNNGGVSPAPRTVLDTFTRLTQQANQIPSYELWRRQEAHIEAVRSGLATLFGCDTEEIAITRNASESLETAQLGIDLKPGDEVVISTQDYPRMLTAWDQRARREGVVAKISYYRCSGDECRRCCACVRSGHHATYASTSCITDHFSNGTDSSCRQALCISSQTQSYQHH